MSIMPSGSTTNVFCVAEAEGKGLSVILKPSELRLRTELERHGAVDSMSAHFPSFLVLSRFSRRLVHWIEGLLLDRNVRNQWYCLGGGTSTARNFIPGAKQATIW
jgi:hypothetical protein